MPCTSKEMSLQSKDGNSRVMPQSNMILASLLALGIIYGLCLCMALGPNSWMDCYGDCDGIFLVALNPPGGQRAT